MTIERGTTQEVIVTIRGWNLTACDIYVTFKQDKVSITKKKMDSVTYANGATRIALTLSQSETMMFNDNSKGLVQARWIDANGEANKTKTAEFSVDKLLYEAVLVKEADNESATES